MLQTIKFKSPNSLKPEPLTAEDATIASLKTLMVSLSNKHRNLSTHIANLTQTAAVSVKSGNRFSALSALRSRKLAEKVLQRCADNLHQLDEVITRLGQAADQVEYVGVVKASADALKSLNKRVGDVDQVDSVMESLREEMAKVDDVSQLVAEPLTEASAAVDEGEIDDEFEALVATEKARTEEREAAVTKKRLEHLDRPGKQEEQGQGHLHEHEQEQGTTESSPDQQSLGHGEPDSQDPDRATVQAKHQKTTGTEELNKLAEHA